MSTDKQNIVEPYITILTNELNQHARPRQELLRKIGEQIGRTAVIFFTSFRYPVMIEEGDADMLVSRQLSSVG